MPTKKTRATFDSDMSGDIKNNPGTLIRGDVLQGHLEDLAESTIFDKDFPDKTIVYKDDAGAIQYLSFAGQGGKIIAVKADETGLEFLDF
jgi:hypothetical protein